MMTTTVTIATTIIKAIVNVETVGERHSHPAFESSKGKKYYIE